MGMLNANPFLHVLTLGTDVHPSQTAHESFSCNKKTSSFHTPLNTFIIVKPLPDPHKGYTTTITQPKELGSIELNKLT